MSQKNKAKHQDRRFGMPVRLYDLINEVGSVPSYDRWLHLTGGRYEDHVEDGLREWARIFPTAHVVNIQNVIDYFKDHYKERKMSFDDFPPLRMPFDSMFFEYTEHSKSGRCRMGVLASTYKGFDHDGYEIWMTDYAKLDASQHVVGPNTVGAFWLNSDFMPTGESCGGAILPQQVKEEFEEVVSAGLQAIGMVVLLAIGFMNCRNVKLESNEPDRKLNNLRKRNGLRPFVRYHTINIEPMKHVLRTEGDIETNGLKKALHICRGHFATLTRNYKGEALEKPVTYWRAAHVRGSIERGVNVADYRVNPPKDK